MKKAKASPAEKIFDVWVQPRASQNEILGLREEYLRLRVTAAPEDGEANRLCRKVLAKALGIPPSQVEIIRGHKARKKRVRAWGIDPAHWPPWGKDAEKEPEG